MALACVCVFCGSSSGNDAALLVAARALGAGLAAHRIAVVYGGAHVGMMGALADGALAAGGEVFGVIPQALVDREVAHRGLTRLDVVGSMHERKARMAELADGFVALPGGLGTLDEFVEIVTWAQLGIHAKPCYMLNLDGYYDKLLGFFADAVAAGLLRQANVDRIQVVASAEELLRVIVGA